MEGRFAGLLRLSIAGLLAGLMTGVLGGAFRYLLDQANQWRGLLLAAGQASGLTGLLAAMVVGACATAAARWLVTRFAPDAAGSGIQRVEAVMRGQVEPARVAIVPIKFVGGLLAIGSGLALGREGPTVQMGSVLGQISGRLVLRNPEHLPVVLAAGAGAGLAVAFNAPIGGAVFIYEELVRRVSAPYLVATLAATGPAIVVLWLFMGDVLTFAVGPPLASALWIVLLHAVMGLLLGSVGVAYGATILWFLRVADVLRAIPSIARAAMIGATIGGIGWLAPELIGGGEEQIEAILSDRMQLGAIAMLCLARFWIGPLSYAALVPGGLFAPLLLIGASFGATFAGVVNHAVPELALSPVAFAIVGMGALFASVVQAPLTGIVLAIEMTGRTELSAALIVGSLAALFVTTWTGSSPIYDRLRERMLTTEPATRRAVERVKGIEPS